MVRLTQGAQHWFWAATCCFVLVFCVASEVRPVAAGDLSKEDRIIAGFVFNFCKVVTWPGEKKNELTLLVIGTDGPSAALSQISGKSSGSRQIRVVAWDPDTSPPPFDLVYLSPTAGADADSVLQSLARSAVLTVSTADDFCREGGMIEMTRDRGHIRLKINQAQADSAGLVISSQLLKLATVVNE